MKHGNWNSRKARKKDLNGCHRASAPAGELVVGERVFAPPRSLGAVAMAIAVRMVMSFGRKR